MLRLAGLLAGVAVAFAAAPDRCPAGYTAFQGRCFKYNASPQNWVRYYLVSVQLALRHALATRLNPGVRRQTLKPSVNLKMQTSHHSLIKTILIFFGPFVLAMNAGLEETTLHPKGTSAASCTIPHFAIGAACALQVPKAEFNPN